MAVNATTVARFFRRDQCGHENDRHFVQRPIRFELHRYFKAVGLRHDKIDKHEIGFEAARRFQRSAWIVFLAHDVIVRVLQKQARAARELAVVIYD